LPATISVYQGSGVSFGAMLTTVWKPLFITNALPVHCREDMARCNSKWC